MYKQYPWIGYSVKHDEIYCYYRRRSLPSNQHYNPNSGNLTVNSYSDRKHISAMAKVHDKLALTKYKGCLDSKTQGSFSTMMSHN